MARHKVEICGVNTANIKVLKNDEMKDLFRKYQEGNLCAKEKLIEGNLKLVLSILKKYTNRIDNMDDLFQVGCIGLIKAIDNFDLSHEVRFSTYAVPMILGELKRYLRDNNSVRIARSIKDLSYKIAKLKEKLTLELEKEPSIQLISERLGVSEYDVIVAIDSTKESISMFEPIYNDGGEVIYLCDQLEDKRDKNFSVEERISLKEALTQLREKEKYVINERYLYGKTQMELSDELGISQAQVSRLEKSGLEHIKKKIL